MKRLLLVCVCGGLLTSAAMAEDPNNRWLAKQSQRGVEIELIRVASEKPLVATKETDAEVASILMELEAIEEETSATEESEESS